MMMVRACVGLAMLAAWLSAAAPAAEELSDRGRKAQAVELDGAGLSGNAEALGRQLRAVGLRLVFLGGAYVPRFDGQVAARDVAVRIAKENELELSWLEGGTVAVFGRKAPDAEKKALKEALASKDPLVWCPAMEEAAGSDDPEVLGWALAQAAADGERAAELARALARGDNLGIVLLINEARGLALAHRALADQDQEVRRNTVAALEDYGGPEAAKLIGRAMEAFKPEVVEQLGLFAALESIGGPEAVKVLEKTLARESLAGRAVETLGQIGGPEAAKALEKALDNEALVGPAVAALGQVGTSAAARVLGKALANPKVGAQALPALEAIGGPAARDALIAHLDVEKGDLGFRQEMERILREEYPDDPKVKDALKKAEEVDKQLEGGVEEGQAVPGVVQPAPAVEF
jgi:HEAT repeat protein